MARRMTIFADQAGKLGPGGDQRAVSAGETMKWISVKCLRTCLVALMLLAPGGLRQAEVRAQEQTDPGWKATGMKGAVVTGCREGAAAGKAMLEAGGNAVDAAVATMLVQSVVESSLFCFGSEVPMLVYSAERGSVEVVAGLGAAPGLATKEWFRANREGVIQGRGDIANCVVPGFLDACLTALDRYGTKSFAECAAPMLEVLRARAAATDETQAELAGPRSNPADPKVWLSHHQNFLRLVDRLVAAEQLAGTDRRRGLRLVADCFYRGPVAQELDAWSRANGGLLRYKDLARHVTRIEDPQSVAFRGHTVCKCGVWTQGPYLLQTLKLLDPLLTDSMQRNSAGYSHAVAEAMKLCLADRDAWYADPHFVEVPIGQLLSDEYLALRRPLIDPAAASAEQRPGDPVGMAALLGKAPQDHIVTSGHSSDTSNCLVADQWGNVVAATPSGWGGVIAGDTGIEMGSRMIGLTCWEGHPSQLVPGKRPRITLTPTMVLRDGKPVLCVSVAGGDQQDQASIQVVLNRLVFGLDPEESVRGPRIGTDHHINWFGHLPFQPASLTVPRSFDSAIADDLRQRGHDVRSGRPAATAVLLVIDPATGEKTAVGENGRHAAAH
jgi:gamma-glutamyltranspeptidase / glutathione hydrolase